MTYIIHIHSLWNDSFLTGSSGQWISSFTWWNTAAERGHNKSYKRDSRGVILGSSPSLASYREPILRLSADRFGQSWFCYIRFLWVFYHTESQTSLLTTEQLPRSSSPRFTTEQLHQSSSPLLTTEQLPQSSSPLFTTEQLPQISSPLFTTEQLQQSSSPRFTAEQLHQSSSPLLTTEHLPQSSSPRFTTEQLPQSSSPLFTTEQLQQSSSPRFTAEQLLQSSSSLFTTEQLRHSSSPRSVHMLTRDEPTRRIYSHDIYKWLILREWYYRIFYCCWFVSQTILCLLWCFLTLFYDSHKVFTKFLGSIFIFCSAPMKVCVMHKMVHRAGLVIQDKKEPGTSKEKTMAGKNTKVRGGTKHMLFSC